MTTRWKSDQPKPIGEKDLPRAGNVHDLISGGQVTGKLPKAGHEDVVPIVLNSQHIRPAFDILGTCRLQYMEIFQRDPGIRQRMGFSAGKAGRGTDSQRPQ